jgi:hypothetical protein
LGNLGFVSAMANVSKCLLMLRRSLATVSEANVAKKLTKADIRKSKTKNLFEVAKLLPNGGVGSKMAKTHWRPGSFYKVTEIKLYKAEGHGMAWGIYHQEGKIFWLSSFQCDCFFSLLYFSVHTVCQE